jgi:hypothetical protein
MIYGLESLALSIAAAFLFCGCGRSGGGGGGAVGEADTFGPLAAPVVGGLNIVVDPFAAEGVPNVVLEADADFGGARFLGVATVPGVHWAWGADLPLDFSLSDGSVWRSVGGEKGASLEGPFRLRYAAKLNSPSDRGWPGVGGGVGLSTGTLLPSSFLFVLPTNLEKPIRVRFQAGGADIPIFHTGTSCGVNCVDFSNWADAIETPLSFAKDTASRLAVGTDSLLPFDVTIKETLSVSNEWVRAEVESARQSLLSVWDFLVAKWGMPAIGNAFRVHLVVGNGCRSQALEHDSSVLAAVGVCSATQFQRDVVSIVAHEMVHVWNGRHIFPSETAAWDPFAFDSSRLKRLYFYEGATEGFARLALAETTSALRNAQMVKWNTTISQMAAVGLGKGLVAISQNSPTLGYEAGSFLALWLAGKSRVAAGGDVAFAKQKFWNILSTLKSGTSAGVFDIATPLAKRKCVSGMVFAPCSGGSLGYSHDDLMHAMKTALGLSNWDSFQAAHLGETFLAAQSDLNAAVSEIAGAAGVSAITSSGKMYFPTDVSAQSGVWPF